MRSIKIVTAVFVTLSLCGCLTLPGTVRAPDYQEVHAQALGHTARLCEETGYERGSQEHSECVAANVENIEQEVVQKVLFDQIDSASGRSN